MIYRKCCLGYARPCDYRDFESLRCNYDSEAAIPDGSCVYFNTLDLILLKLYELGGEANMSELIQVLQYPDYYKHFLVEYFKHLRDIRLVNLMISNNAEPRVKLTREGISKAKALKGEEE